VSFDCRTTANTTLVVGHAGGGSEGRVEVVFGSGETVSELIDNADTYRVQNNYTQAIEEYTRALALDPRNAHAYFYRAYSYGENDEFEKSVADYNQAIEYGFSPLEWAYHNRGWSYRNVGEYEKAIADFDRAIEIDPDYGLAYDNRDTPILRWVTMRRPLKTTPARSIWTPTTPAPSSIAPLAMVK